MKNPLNRIALAVALGLGLAVVPAIGANASSASAVTVTQAKAPQAEWPIAKKTYRYTSSFGARCPVLAGASTFHGAIDLAATDGTPLYAMFPGTVSKIVAPSGTVTPTVYIDHGIINGKKLIASYGHMANPTKYVKLGATVKAGQRIADVGSAGISNGPHVHLSLDWGGEAIDPIPFLKGVGIDIVAQATSVTAQAPATTCTVYTGTQAALKAEENWNSDTKVVLPKNTKVTIEAGKPVNGMIYATSTPNGPGYIQAAPLSPKTVTDNQPALKYGTTDKGKTFVPLGTRHLFDYPSNTVSIRGVIDTVQKGVPMVTTGRTYEEYTEVKTNGLTGWIIAAKGTVQEVYTPTSFGKIAAGGYTALSTYSIYSSPTKDSTTYYVTYPHKLANGIAVVATGRTAGEFMEVTYEGTTGWVLQVGLKKNYEPTSFGKIEAGGYTALSTYSIYSAPTKDNKSYFVTYPYTLANGIQLVGTGRTHGEFAEVQYEGVTGWVLQVGLKKNYEPTDFGAVEAGGYTALSTYSVYSAPTKDNAKYFVTYPHKLANGIQLTGTGRSHGEFIEVQYEGVTGWVLQIGLKKNYEPTEFGSIEAGNYTATSTYSVYSAPTKDNAKYFVTYPYKLANGIQLVGTGRTHGEFAEVQYEGVTGWVLQVGLKKNYEPTDFGQIEAGSYSARGAYSIYSAPTKDNSTYFVTYPYKLSINVPVTATGRTHGEFMEVQYGGVTGWMVQIGLKKI